MITELRKIIFFLLFYSFPYICNICFDNYKISVIIPIYNSEKYLSSCLNSVISQTLKNFEIICIEDGSKDKSLSILKEYQKHENRLRIILQKNQGSGIARNKGINISKGKFISFLDSDDLYPNNSTLELLYNKAIKTKSLICGGGLNEFEYINNTIKFLNIREEFIFNEETIINYNDYQFDYGYYRFLYNKRFLKSNNIYFSNYSRYQDPPFLIKAMSAAKYFYALKQITYYYRLSDKVWNINKIIDQYKGFMYSLSLSKSFNLNKLYCKIIQRLNTYIFLSPTKRFINDKIVFSLIIEILKNINYDILNKENISFELDKFYKNLLNKTKCNNI